MIFVLLLQVTTDMLKHLSYKNMYGGKASSVGPTKYLRLLKILIIDIKTFSFIRRGHLLLNISSM